MIRSRSSHPSRQSPNLYREMCGHVISRSVSGSPGRRILARRLLPPWNADGCVTTSHSKPWSVNRSPI